MTANYRGVAFWPGDRQNPPRILFTAAQDGISQGPQSVARFKTLIALNAKSGKLDPGFGKEGMLALDVGYAGVPTVFKNLVMLGAYGQEHDPFGQKIKTH